MASTIHVEAPGGGYDIQIGRGLLDQVSGVLSRLKLSGRVGILTNSTLLPLYGEPLLRALPNAVTIAMPDGEQYKTLDTVAQLYSDMVAAGLDRSSAVVALGGGVVGDTAGFAAATYMRGVGLVQVPTSLLAMVDSSVGGKVGVDLPQGKNLVGAFKQPDAVIIDPDVLETLPAREWRCGMAEVIKHGLLADPVLLDLAAESRQSAESAETLVTRAVQVKVDIVQRDPFEKAERAHLNLGHTFAHAIEIVSNFGWQHGEAVAIGLVAAARLSHRLQLCDAELPAQVERLVAQVGLATRMGALDADALWTTMGTDKKWQNGEARFILLRGIGQPILVRGVERDAVCAVLESLK